MAWKNANELLDDVYDTLQRLRGGRSERSQVKVEARLLDTGTRLMSMMADASVRSGAIKAA